MTSNIERRLKRLEGMSVGDNELVFMIEDDGNRPDEERLRMLGILDKPGRNFQVISVEILSPGPQPAEPLPPNVSPWESGNWQRTPIHKEPVLCWFGRQNGPHRPGSEWVREF